MPFNLRRRDKTYIMGVLNVTPDSFYDGGKFFDPKNALLHAIDMVHQGADIIDIGGESTRPGAADVSVDEELARVIPVIEAVSKETDVLISIDTRKAAVAKAAIKAGADIINDISAMEFDPEMAAVAAPNGAGIILMHMKGAPKDMQNDPVYDDVVKEVKESLKRAIERSTAAGIKEDNLIIDPGIGFGKTVEHNLELLRRLDEFKELKLPICVGTSRKSFIGKVLGREDPADRLIGSLTTFVVSIMKGAAILRVHDVREAYQAARMADSIMGKRG